MAPGHAADVNQDSACCRADSEPAGSARPDDVKTMCMYGGEGWRVISYHALKMDGGKFVSVVPQ